MRAELPLPALESMQAEPGVRPDLVDEAADPELETLRAAVRRCADALVGTAFTDRDRAGWLSWELTADGRPTTMRGGNPALYDGDSGNAYACALLGVALDRSDLVDLAVRAGRHALRRSSQLDPGLLGGRAGVELAVHRIEGLTGERIEGGQSAGRWGAPGRRTGSGESSLPDATQRGGPDLTDGLAGELYAAAALGARQAMLQQLIDELGSRAVPGPVGLSWSDPTADPRPLCGLAHGASGIAFAVAEAGACRPELAPAARRLAGGALAWERAWFDPIRGSWPDLRSDSLSYPAWWCHGAAGIGLVRLRLLSLQRVGVDLGLSEPALLAEASAAIRAGSAELARAVAAGGHSAGLTLCHGAGGSLELLLRAAEVLGVDEHRRLAVRFAAALVPGLDDDPRQWPTGLPVIGGGGLFLGLAGTAAVLARLAFPQRELAGVALL